MSETNSAVILTLPASDSYEVCLGTYSLVLSKNAAKAWERLYCNLIALSRSPIATSGSDFVALVFYMCVRHRPEKTQEKKTDHLFIMSHACIFVPISFCLIQQRILTHFRLRG